MRHSRALVGRYHAPGTPPGTLSGVAEGQAPPAAALRLGLMRYTAAALEEHSELPIEACRAPDQSGAVTWLHVQGTPTPELLERLGEVYELHPLALEDALNRGQRTKFEIYDGHYFVVLNRPRRDAEGALFVSQVSLFLGANYVITMDECPDDGFDPIRARLRTKPRFRERGADYLFYALIDLIVDEGFPLLEDFGDRMEDLENEVLEAPSKLLRNRIHYAKRELLLLRRAWWPQREVLAALIRDGEERLSETTRLYLRDCQDHSMRVVDFVETYREMTSSLLDTYLSSVSQRMNDIMKVLTIIATIFMPLTFVVGVYGMNFDTASPWNMPELHWRYGYFYALGIMLVIALGMLFYFRRKRWL